MGGDAHERGEPAQPQRFPIEIVDRRAPARHRGSALGTARFVAWTLFSCAAHAQGWTAYRPNGGNTTNPDSNDERQRGSSYQPKDSTTTYTEFQSPDGQIKHCTTFRLNDSSAVRTDCQ